MAEPLTEPQLAAIRARSAAEDVTHEGRRFLPGAQPDRRALLAEVDRLRETLARVRALVSLPQRPEDYDETVTEYQAVVGSTWDEAYWHAAMSHVDAALGAVPEEQP